jgi:hypothetical protein
MFPCVFESVHSPRWHDKKTLILRRLDETESRGMEEEMGETREEKNGTKPGRELCSRAPNLVCTSHVPCGGLLAADCRAADSLRHFGFSLSTRISHPDGHLLLKRIRDQNV